MLAPVTKSALLLVGVAGLAASSQMAQGQMEWYRTAIESGVPKTAPPYIQDSRLAPVLDEWRRLQQSDNWPFADYANFLIAHPGWPGETSRRAAAETVLANGSDAPGLITRFFERFPPLTAAGKLRYAEALLASGRRGEAEEQARQAWRKGSMRPVDETALLATFPGALTADDHDVRADLLIWNGSTTAASRLLGLVPQRKRALYDARIAYRTNAPDAADKGAAVDAAGRSDAGYIADRATWLRASNQGMAARAYLGQPRRLSARPGNVEKWYEVLLTAARGAQADGQYDLAYRIASQVDDAYPAGTDVSDRPLGERDDYTSLTWLAGTVAFYNLNRPSDAIGMFDRYGHGSKTPQTNSKGLYWAGRAAEAAGQDAAASVFYDKAAGFPDLFYGQLALERTGRPLKAPPSFVGRVSDAAVRDAFYKRETVRAAQLLGTLNRYDEQGLFIRQIASDATSDTDHLLAAELSRAIGRPDLGVMVGRSALQNGLSDYTAAGYPSVRVPEAQQDYWTIIHAIARQESQFDRAAVSHAGARGLMQLMPGTARETAGKIGLGYNRDALTVDTDYNIQLGSTYFKRMHAQYGSYPLAVAAYNAGPGNVNKWIRANGDPRLPGGDIVRWVEQIPIFETKNYVQRVLENAVVYDLLNPQRARSQGPSNLSWYLGKNRPG
ncbi:lytic transglycosylase domain-containing protein [Sphingomonas sp. G-3-2-10]|uniref:lytic transglycosylase domain-containing protein n=1 Tax=Sphingomonas sp. G-3-2-10 TaxID=2728838 RepID=UPI00146E31BB|nr:lytic transglycosylase domain-containing protein [Sphingomonas sp. G-3-2-10]NML05342.1 lytic transglycosylase domain-containing protein [Sphingomonas sp. G-3-2-10]